MRTLWPAVCARAVASGLFLVLGCGPGEVVVERTAWPQVAAALEGEPPALNGCSESDYVVLHESLVVIRFGAEFGHNYSPACLRVAAGTRIRFEGPMGMHPVEPGRVVDSIPLDAAGPVPSVASGNSADFVARGVGKFGYFCDIHVAEGMMGAIDVMDPVRALALR